MIDDLATRKCNWIQKKLLLLWPKVEIQYAAGKVKIHHFQHVISLTCSIDRKFSVEPFSRPTLVSISWKMKIKILFL